MDYSKVAEILEAAADYLDEIESQKLAAETEARNARLDKLAARYEHSTGESLADDLRGKLANLDTDALDHLLKVANNSSDSPESLGGPAELNDDPAPRTVKEAADQAEEKFLDWVLS